ncbi:MAG: putative transport system ATP-binding protein, partial [Pseudonocardiales bacterium]|nr:putative transport system ATP-binding protein [Pseudonocardiales bacterium]
ADEPTGNLDSTASTEIAQMLVRLSDAGRTVVLITHEEEIASYARRVIRLRDGRVVDDSADSADSADRAGVGAPVPVEVAE